jgi:hypothetical protein
MWQILSHDYDTQASFYAVKKACEPIHVQLDLSNYSVDVVNATRTALANVSVSAKVYSLQSKMLLEHTQEVNAAADATVPSFKLDLAPLLSSGMVFVRLELRSSAGRLLSSNFYWLGKDAASYRQLNDLPLVAVSASATSRRLKDQMQVNVKLEGNSATAALAVKLTLQDSVSGVRILPAYLSDNYVSLLPGETRSIEIQYPVDGAHHAPQLSLRGWNVVPELVSISPP